jgi:hypothetical protein
MASHSEVANRWADKLTGITDKGHLKGSRVFVHVDKLYSYGTHFELARFVRPKKGRPFFPLERRHLQRHYLTPSIGYTVGRGAGS